MALTEKHGVLVGVALITATCAWLGIQYPHERDEALYLMGNIIYEKLPSFTPLEKILMLLIGGKVVHWMCTWTAYRETTTFFTPFEAKRD